MGGGNSKWPLMNISQRKAILKDAVLDCIKGVCP